MSSQSDHDRALERLLRAMPDNPTGPTPACIDAERLAAWSDGGLTPAERDAIDAHLASCARCLAMLAAFSETAGAHAGSVPAQEIGPSPRAPGRIIKWPLGWVVPITTAAAAVLIWMVLPARPPQRTVAPATQVARDETAPAASAPQRFDAPSGDQARESAVRQPPAVPATPPPRALSKATGPADAEEPERRREQAAVTESVQLAPAQEPAAKATDTSASGQRAANESAMSDRVGAARPSAPPPAAAPVARPQAPVALMRAEAAPVEIFSPDSARRWQIRGALVERSTNGGSSWQAATTPAGAVVTTGTSPAGDVCWLVGPNGTVLRTTNGSRFEAANIPGAGTLVSAQATDADHATVRAADGRVYVTEDGGKSWK